MIRASMKLTWLKSPWFYAAAITFSGSSLHHIDMRGTAAKPLVISLPRMSPALAAMEDTVKTWGVESVSKKAAVEVTLLAGQSGALMAERLLKQPAIPYEIRLQQWLARIPLGGRLVVSQSPVPTPVAPVALKGLVVRQAPQPSPTLVAQNETSSIPAVALSPTPITTMPVGERKPASLRDQLIAQYANEDWSQPTLRERALKLIEKEGPAPTDKTVRYERGILVASPTVSSGSTGSTGTSSSPKLAASPVNPTQGQEPQPGISWAKPDDGQAVRSTLSGSLRFAGGLAITDPSERLMVFREWQGLMVEKAQVWLNDGRFEIVTNSLRGELRAQLRDARGQILGEGEIKLNQLKPNASTDRIEDLMLTLRPVFAGARVEVASAHSYGQHLEPVAGAKVWMSGQNQPLKPDQDRQYFTVEGLKTGSSYVAQAMADNHWGTIVVGLSGQDARARLFPDKMVEALLNLTVGSDQEQARRAGVVWGRVTKNGVPLAGARVEMAGDHRQQAHYFNSLLLPDRYAGATGENGTFAFVWVTPGIQSVRVVYQGQSWPTQIIPVEGGHVSYLDFELGEPDSVPLEIADPLDPGKEVNAVLRWAGDETSEIDIQGRGRLGLASGPGLLMLEADAGASYELMRYSIPRNTRRVHLQVVRRDWLASLAARKRINLDAGVGAAVGFSMDDEFSVQIDNDPNSSSSPEVVYFDANGQALFTDEGVAGGGFVIYNVTPGLRTLSLISKNSRQLQSQVILVSPEAVNQYMNSDR